MRKISSNVPLVVCLIVFIMSMGAIWILVESQGRVFAQGRKRSGLSRRGNLSGC